MEDEGRTYRSELTTHLILSWRMQDANAELSILVDIWVEEGLKEFKTWWGVWIV